MKKISSFFFRHKFLLIFPGLCLIFSLGIGIAYLTTHTFSEDVRFQKLMDSFFKEEVTSSSLTLHYTLADPASYGIAAPDPTLGTLCADTSLSKDLCHTYESKLLRFDPEKLSLDHQVTRDTLLLYFHTQQQLLSHPLLYEPLSPSLGIQAQLPVLLAEYSFYSRQDVLDYLKLLASIKPYFESILSYEQEKASAGFFMSDLTLDRIEKQCQSFISDPEHNYMQEIFEENIASLSDFSKEEMNKLSVYHQKIIREEVIPSYQQLLKGLEALRGSGCNVRGLAGFPDGASYYQALFQSETGIYEPIAYVEQQLSRQLQKDSRQISLMLKEQSSLLTKMNDPSLFSDIAPEQTLTVLKDAMETDFPPLPDVTSEIRTVHPSMQEYLSPAFYLTPPMDTCSPNVIYINEKNHASGLELFTTLAHEGFPGHLYQTVSFERENCCPVRYLITTPGYTEGWATYIESWAAEKAIPLIQDPAARDLAHLFTLNRNINLCLYSLLDIGIHYHGWSLANVTRFLTAVGIKNPDTAQNIYQYIVENPANYPKYFAGALEFNSLKESEKQRLGDDFSLKEFHQKVLSIGPVPFPVLKKYLSVS